MDGYAAALECLPSDEPTERPLEQLKYHTA